jgi:hypothetical protein
MNQFNLTIGQAIDLMLGGKIVVNVMGYKYHFIGGAFKYVNNDNIFLDFSTKLKFKEYIEPKEVKLVTWYVPTVCWCESDKQPISYGYSKYYKSKDDYFNSSGLKNIKILEWKEILAPETWEQC